MRPAVLASALGLALALTTIAAQSAQPARSPAERREALQRLTDDLNGPDPLARMATLESALTSDDPVAREIAARIALGSADAQMRDYTVLLLLSQTKVINLDLKLPATIQMQVDAAQGDKAKLNVVERNWAHTWWARTTDGGVINFRFHDFDLSSGTFQATCDAPQPKDFPGQISGTRLQFKGACQLSYGGSRLVETCSASMDLQSDGSFAGNFTCSRFELPLLASFRLR